ncbi:MAG: response regulator [Alphaproteobacteria bacterium]|nr:MAG: response regulator [Alphaproteobacteria bacterium]
MRISYHIVGAFLLVTLSFGAAYTLVSHERDSAVLDAEHRAKRLVTFFQTHVASTFRYADDYIKMIRLEFRRTGSLDGVRKLMRQVPPDNNILSHVTIMNADAVPVLLSTGRQERRIKPGIHARDRDYFNFQKASAKDQVFISMARKGRNTGLVTVRLVRRIADGEGNFQGVIFAAVKAEQLLAFFKTTRMGPNSSATLVGLDKVIRLRVTDKLEGVGRKIEASLLWQKLKESPVGVYHQTSIVDGTPRIWAYRKLDTIPVVAVIGAAIPDALAAIGVHEVYIYAIAGLISLIVCALLFLSIREKVAADKSEILQATFENMNQGIAVFDARHRLAAFNGKFAEITELPDDFLRIGLTREEVLRFRASQKAFGDEDVETIISDKSAQSRRSLRHERTLPNGRIYVYERAILPDGGYISTVTDVTADREAKHRLEQAQKMEAVGQLTGGVAHDFNNLLAVIMGNAELLAAGPENAAALIDNISRSAKRGAELTQRLLAFSRNQPLHPQPVDMSELIANMRALLERTLGETIEISWDMASGLWQASADPGQVENALLNLALNARDAMPGGGKLAVACANTHLDGDGPGENFEIAAGDYVVLAVADTGTGMTDEVLNHAFEPFYTTKEVGQGSGLGLSMVYGFAKQSGGHVTIDSEVGKGTTVRLYLPRALAGVSTEADSGGEKVPMGRGETVLVVEDDVDVRDLVEAMIDSLGYRVITASTAAEAQTALECQEIDLVLSDVILPGGVNGPAFVKEARHRHPGLRVVFMSGYPADAANQDGALGRNDELLNKPFRKKAIAEALHEALN